MEEFLQQKLEVVVTLKEKKIFSILKNHNFITDKPFSKLRISFINDLSKSIIIDKRTKKYIDLISYSFWLRNSNIQKFNLDDDNCFGLGLIFHVAPSNVPMTFAYSFAISFLLGNDNIVKIPSKQFEQVNIFLSIFSKILKKKIYKNIRNNYFISYDHTKTKITESISLFADARLIWGGDKTVEKIKKINSKINCRDILFSDKYSCSLLNLIEIKKLNNSQLRKLIDNFCRDIFFADQKACSSPNLIIWYGKFGNLNNSTIRLFWEEVANNFKKNYKRDLSTSILKHVNFCRDCVSFKNIKKFNIKKNYISIFNVNNFKTKITQLRSGMGSFYQVKIRDFSELNKFVNQKYQTLTYFGFSKHFIKNNFRSSKIKGFDRVVPFGQAHDMTFNWDGYNLFYFLTKKKEFN